MFIFFPIGHENHKVRRIPVVTIVTILLCLVIAIVTIPRAKTLTHELIGVEEEIAELKLRVYQKYATIEKDSWVYDFLFENEARNYKEFWEKFGDKVEQYWQNFIDGKIGEPDDPLFKRYLVLKERREEIEREHPFLRFGFIPARFNVLTMITAAFLHGNWLHLFFNMLFFFIVAPNLEDIWGRPILLGVYLASAIAASLFHMAMYPHSTEPCVGASGAIAGLMGAFAYRFAKTKLDVWYFILILVKPLIGIARIPAYLFFSFWFLLQLFWGVMVKSAPEFSNIAFWAHIGGFVFGLAFAMVFVKTGVEQKYVTPKVEEKVSPEVKLDPRLTKALELHSLGNYQEAIALLDNYLEDNPHSDFAKLERIKNYVGIQKVPPNAAADLSSIVGSPEFGKQAVDLYIQICRFDKTFCLNPDATFRVFRHFDRNRDLTGAKLLFEIMRERLKKDQRMPAMYISMARLSMRFGEVTYAREILEEMLVRFPSDPLIDLAKEDLGKIRNA